MGRLILGAWAALVSASALAIPAYNMPKGVTAISQEVFGLHMLVFWICCAIGAVVFGVMIYSIIAHRRSVHPKPADFHESMKVEIAWTVVPFFILIAMAIPAAGTLIKMEDHSNPDMTIKVTGYQWKWQYEYLDHDIEFFSTLSADSNKARQLGSGVDPDSVPHYLLSVDKEVVLPIGKKIRILLTSNDVLHAWWVPELAVKKDAIPGYINQMWTKIDKPGIYRGQCAELCGRDHGYMPIVVRAVSQEVFDEWVKNKGGNITTASAPVEAAPAMEVAAAATAEPAAPGAITKDSLMKQGAKVYKNYCAACHGADGKGLPAANFPPLTGSKVVNGPAAEHVDRVLKGQNAMASFAYLDDVEIAAVVTYERNALGNSAGDVVTPEQVKSLRSR